jgi:hypothetical protein
LLRDRAVATAATEELAKQYFDNHQVLLKILCRTAGGTIKRIYQIRDTWKDVLYLSYRRYHVGKKRYLADCRLMFNLEPLKRSIDATKLVKSLVDQANADTLELTGERQAALELLVSRVDTGGPSNRRGRFGRRALRQPGADRRRNPHGETQKQQVRQTLRNLLARGS